MQILLVAECGAHSWRVSHQTMTAELHCFYRGSKKSLISEACNLHLGSFSSFALSSAKKFHFSRTFQDDTKGLQNKKAWESPRIILDPFLKTLCTLLSRQLYVFAATCCNVFLTEQGCIQASSNIHVTICKTYIITHEIVFYFANSLPQSSPICRACWPINKPKRTGVPCNLDDADGSC